MSIKESIRKRGALLLLSGVVGISTAFGASDSRWFEIPFRADGAGVTGEYIYFVGGYNSIDAGTPPWGSIVESDNLYVGDKGGAIEIAYEDGSCDVVPLVFGYTLWFRAHWMDGGAPFKTSEVEPEMAECLRETLHLCGGFEGSEHPVLRVKVQQKPIREIRLVDNPDKRGEPQFLGGYVVGESGQADELTGGPVAVKPDDPFFDTHTVDSRREGMPYAALDKLCERLYTFESDFKRVDPWSYPSDFELTRITFSGNSYADILTRVYYENLEDIRTKMREDGMIDESSPGAPSWRYDGFGTWVPEANSYYGSMYSRNRPLGILSYIGLLKESQRSVDFLNRWLMYYPEHGLTLLGHRIPGHWSVIPNKPFVYSKELTVVAGWPTRYTRERFGDDYQNFGNAEPDGHGLTMMSIANVWANGGYSPQWVLDNWKYINEAVHYIDWAMENPDLSFNEHGLMYGETEGGMMEFTMFNNMPCYLGVRMYTEMARRAGKLDKVAAWTRLADEMERSIESYFIEGDKWRMDKFGFFHDPTLSIYADYVGYDVTQGVPQKWIELSRNTYEDDLNRYIGDTYMGVRGLGYDHNIISQTALLLDKCADYDRFITNLAKLCYAPRLPKPFIVPEGASYNREKGMYRRQGDLGNFVQQNETVRTILMVAGTSKAREHEITVMPRLPKGWAVEVSGITVNGSDAKISYRVNYPNGRKQTARFRIDERAGMDRLKFRAGPFSMDNETVKVNGEEIQTEPIGDARWAWVTIEGLVNGEEYVIEVR